MPVHNNTYFRAGVAVRHPRLPDAGRDSRIAVPGRLSEIRNNI
jgi:hypothetical protein